MQVQQLFKQATDIYHQKQYVYRQPLGNITQLKAQLVNQVPGQSKTILLQNKSEFNQPKFIGNKVHGQCSALASELQQRLNEQLNNNLFCIGAGPFLHFQPHVFVISHPNLNLQLRNSIVLDPALNTKGLLSTLPEYQQSLSQVNSHIASKHQAQGIEHYKFEVNKFTEIVFLGEESAWQGQNQIQKPKYLSLNGSLTTQGKICLHLCLYDPSNKKTHSNYKIPPSKDKYNLTHDLNYLQRLLLNL